MANEKWKKIEGNTFMRFEMIGDSCEGKLKEIREGEFGENYVITQTDGSDIEVAGTSVIKSKMRNIQIGTPILIRYIGEKKSKTGRLYKDYELFTA